MAPGTMGLITLPAPHRPTGDGLEFLFGVLSTREAAIYLGVSESAVRAEASAGRLPGQPLDGDWRFVRFALAEWLYRGAHSAATVPHRDPTPGAKLAREIAAFEALLPDLLTTHRDEFVAVHDGRVVAHGPDRVAVARAAYDACGYQEILVRRVSETPQPAVRIGGNTVTARGPV